MYNNDRKKHISGVPMQRKIPSPITRARTDEDEPLFKKIMISSLWGVGASAVSGILLVSVLSFAAYKSADPTSLITTLSLLSLLPSDFLGGFVAAKKSGAAPFVCGTVTAGVWCALSFALSVCLYTAPSSGYDFWQGLLLHLAASLFCILGAFAGGIKRKPSRKKRRFG